MAVVAVTFTGTRVNSSDANTNWGNWGGGGPTPASEPQLRYQYSGTGSVGAVNRKVTTTAGRDGVDYDPGSGAVDMTAAANPLWFAKVYVADFGDLNATFGVGLGIGSANNAFYEYNVAGSGANRSVFNTYPAQGGYLIVAVNPSISAWREGTGTGNPSLSAVDWFGVRAEFVAGGAKSENVAMDAIDVGRGLLLVGGDGVSADGTFIDFLTTDQDTIANRWGVVDGLAPIVNCRGLLTIGSTTENDFDDSTSIVLFVDGYHGPGDVGVKVDLSNASSVINVGCQLIGLGSSTTSDTRPDFTVSGTTGACTVAATIQNHRNVVLTSATTVDGADIEADDIAVSSAEIKNSIIRPVTASGVAMINDAAFGTTSGIHDTEFVQGGSGHAIELVSGSSFTFTNIDFSGFSGTLGSNPTANSGDNAAAIYNNTGGAVTITISGGSNFSVRNGAGSTTTVITNVVTITGKAVTIAGVAIQNARLFLATGAAGSLPYLDSVTISNSGTTATVTHTGHGLSTGDKVVIYGAGRNDNLSTKTITVTGANTYTFTTTGSHSGADPNNGSITASFVFLEGLTDVNGEVSLTRSIPANQTAVGRVRKSSAADNPKYKNTVLTGTVSSSANTNFTGVMIED